MQKLNIHYPSKIYTRYTDLGPETIRNEYKNFRMCKEDIFALCRSGILKMIIEGKKWSFLDFYFGKCLKKYIKRYVPKYAISFANADIETGNLYFGVSDSGIIEGMCFTRDMCKNNFHFIKKYISSALRRSLGVRAYRKIVKRMKINIHIFDNHKSPVILTEYFNSSAEIKMKYEFNYEIYVSAHKKWMRQIDRYKSSINAMCNDPELRLEIIDYVKKYDSVSMSIREVMIKRLRDPEPIIFERNDIPKRKNDITDIAFWVTSFRDRVSNTLTSCRPIYTRVKKPECPYYVMTRDMNPMISMMSNDGIKCGIIHIEFPGRRIIKHKNHLPLDDGFIKKYLVRSIDINGFPITRYI